MGRYSSSQTWSQLRCSLQTPIIHSPSLRSNPKQILKYSSQKGGNPSKMGWQDAFDGSNSIVPRRNPNSRKPENSWSVINACKAKATKVGEGVRGEKQTVRRWRIRHAFAGRRRRLLDSQSSIKVSSRKEISELFRNWRKSIISNSWNRCHTERREVGRFGRSTSHQTRRV